MCTVCVVMFMSCLLYIYIYMMVKQNIEFFSWVWDLTLVFIVSYFPTQHAVLKEVKWIIHLEWRSLDTWWKCCGWKVACLRQGFTVLVVHPVNLLELSMHTDCVFRQTSSRQSPINSSHNWLDLDTSRKDISHSPRVYLDTSRNHTYLTPHAILEPKEFMTLSIGQKLSSWSTPRSTREWFHEGLWKREKGQPW